MGIDITACRTIEEYPQFEGVTVYNYEGVHFRVFESMSEALLWLSSGDDTLIIGEFSSGEELDEWLNSKGGSHGMEKSCKP